MGEGSCRLSVAGCQLQVVSWGLELRVNMVVILSGASALLFFRREIAAGGRGVEGPLLPDIITSDMGPAGGVRSQQGLEVLRLRTRKRRERSAQDDSPQNSRWSKHRCVDVAEFAAFLRRSAEIPF